MGIWQTIKKVGRFIDNPANVDKSKVRSLVVPFSPASKGAAVVKGTGNIIKTFYEGVKSFTTKKTINPAAGQTGSKVLSTLGKAVGTGALVGGIFQGGRLIAKAGVSGELPSASDAAKSISRGVTTGAGLGLSPLGGALGALEGGATKGVQTVKQQVQNIFGLGQSRIEDATNIFKNVKDTLPTSPTTNIYNYLPEKFSPQDIMPQTPQMLYLESPAVPSISTPSFSPSISMGGIGGGLSENLPLLLLAAGLGGGYLLGKRKRKKKRYKKRKRRK